MKTNNDRGTSERRYKKEERRVCAEKVFEEIMAPNFPNLVKGINTQIQEARGTSNRMRPKNQTAENQKQRNRMLTTIREK